VILGFAHPGLVVPDLEKARRFYEEMFGFRHFCDEGWSDSPAADRVTGLQGSACRGVTLAGHNCYLELFEFSRPEQPESDGESADANVQGIRHLCFFVDDCRAEYERLLELGASCSANRRTSAAASTRSTAAIPSAISSNLRNRRVLTRICAICRALALSGVTQADQGITLSSD